MERDPRPASFSQTHNLASGESLTQNPSHPSKNQKSCFTFLDSRKWACCPSHWYDTAAAQEAASSYQGRSSADIEGCAAQDCMVPFGKAMMMGFPKWFPKAPPLRSELRKNLSFCSKTSIKFPLKNVFGCNSALTVNMDSCLCEYFIISISHLYF